MIKNKKANPTKNRQTPYQHTPPTPQPTKPTTPWRNMSLLTSKISKYGLFSVYVNLPNKNAQSHLKGIACSVDVLKY